MLSTNKGLPLRFITILNYLKIKWTEKSNYNFSFNMGNRQPLYVGQNNPQAQNLLEPPAHDAIPNISSPTQDQTMTPTPTVIEQVHIRGSSLTVQADSPTTFSLSFTFDALTDCTISLYFFAIETLMSTGVTECYYVDTSRFPVPCTHTFSAGLDQNFPQNLAIFDTGKYSFHELSHADGKTYPLVIEIRASVTSRIIESTYIKFGMSGNQYQPKLIRQKLSMNELCYELHDIYGTTTGCEDEETPECVVCLTNRKDTLVIPCCHMCLCVECANIMRSHHNSRCPICRTNVETLINITVQT
ncbi:RNF157_3 [Blepharisma stoltei]|uniref:RING-type E3 ubiquitin transferase n=1 Tax=Blepharisma stoltei TaxID=1481888 RepID=A0AAU9JCW0_9CILI|nr:unnamed protein product [Blepharisma stoltei]